MLSNRKPTIYDVARTAGVSTAAVSKVIRNAYGVSPAMKTKVTAAIDELGYRPSSTAQTLAGAGSRVGIEMPGISNPFFIQIISGAMEGLDNSGFQLVVAPSMRPENEGSKALESLVDGHVVGLIAISPHGTRPWLEDLARRTPMVMIGRHDKTDVFDTVTGDDHRGAASVMEHLLGLGHRDIVHLTRGEETTAPEAATPHSLRLEEYLASMTKAGLSDRVRVVRSGASEVESYHATVELLEQGSGPTAVFAGNDEMAFGVLRAARERGLSPSELSVVGYDDAAVAGFPQVDLTTVNQSGEGMGRRAVALLLERIAGRTESVHERLEPRLVVRGSSAAPRTW